MHTASLLDDLDPLSAKSLSSTPAPTTAAPVLPAAQHRNPAAFLGENSALVNLDNLIKPAAPAPQSAFGAGALGAAYSNPFGETGAGAGAGGAHSKTNLFQQQAQPVCENDWGT